MDIFRAVKCGDLARVTFLVEEERVSLQQRDAWDATPLYYAAFTGNQNLVKYLLGSGASCEEKTFDGERCLYAALNDETRELLLAGSFKRAGARRHDLYLDFLEKIFVATDSFQDIAFGMDHRGPLAAHRFMLSSRCPALGAIIALHWSASDVVNSFQGMEPDLLKAVIEWCYTTRLEVHSAYLNACLTLLNRLQLVPLAIQLSEEAKKEGAGGKYGKLIVEPGRDLAKAQLQEDLSRTAEACTSGRESDYPLFNDVVILVKGRRFKAHKAILCARSDYFRILLTSESFREGRLSAELRQYGFGHQQQELDLALAPAEIVGTALQWMYTDKIGMNLPVEHLLQALRLSEALMCDGLKQKCALHLQPHVTVETAIPFLSEAYQLGAQRLENACLWVIAQDLEELIDEPEFAALVQRSASSVQERQEFDSVPIIDELRFFISQIHGEEITSDNEAYWDEEGNIICSGQEEEFAMLSHGMQKLYLLQELLGRLGFEA